MPGGDRTGPRGAGQKTGRAAGYCAGADVPGWMNAGAGGGGGFGAGRRAGADMGFGRGRGGGWGRGGGRGAGWRWRAFPASASPVESQPDSQRDMQPIAEMLDRMRADLADIRSRIERLESTGSGGKGES